MRMRHNTGQTSCPPPPSHQPNGQLTAGGICYIARPAGVTSIKGKAGNNILLSASISCEYSKCFEEPVHFWPAPDPEHFWPATDPIHFLTDPDPVHF